MVDTVYMMAFGYSFALVAAGSALHALWNVLVKRSGTSDVAFVWVYSAITAPLWLVVLTVVASSGGLGPAWWASLVSTALHTAYAAVLQRAYSAADLSVVYPVSRGLAPVLVTVMAAPWNGGTSVMQVAALPAVLAGVVLASGATWRNLTRARGLWAGSAVASCTAAYTLWDAFAVAHLHVSVVPYMALSSLAQLVLLTVVLGRRRRELPAALAAGWARALPIAVLVPASYALVLVAMRFGPPSVVATSRSLNVVFGVIAGVWLLREPFTGRSVRGVAMIVVGVLMGAS